MRAAHALKGSASNFGAAGVTELSLRLEEQGRDGKLDGASSLYDSLAGAVDRLRGQLEALCEEEVA